jgi:hypothetical protein
MGIGVLFRGVKQLEREAENSAPTYAKVNKM